MPNQRHAHNPNALHTGQSQTSEQGNDPNNPNNGGTNIIENARPKRPKKCKKNTKAAIKLAALNIRGHGSMDIEHLNNKWGGINAMMTTRKIGILIVGEAHMDSERRDNIEKKYQNLKIFFSKLNDTSNAAGIAVIFNKEHTNTHGIQMHEIIAGHAMLIETMYHDKNNLSILAVYAPNCDTAANTTCWKKIQEFFTTHPRIRRPDFMLGDLNMVEEALDRLPSRQDPIPILEAFDNLKVSLQLEDGWRNTFPTRLEYTYKQERAGQDPRHSRLDRIYVKSEAMEHTYDWEIEKPLIKTDHEMISVKYTSTLAPDIGKGRWVMPTHILYDKEVANFLQSEGLLLEEELNKMELAPWNPEHNAQTEWASFKNSFITLARRRAKIVIPRIEKEI
ncbi:hypothetical protein GG344DRAFT_60034, partial [Lentinula edodes]